MSITVYPGSDGETMLYEDDGRTFRYRKGEWTGIDLKWRDRERMLALRLWPGSRMLPPSGRPLTLRVAGSPKAEVAFAGRPLDAKL